MQSQQITYQVTLPSGMVATNPHELAMLRAVAQAQSGVPIVAADGTVLVPPLKVEENEPN